MCSTQARLVAGGRFSEQLGAGPGGTDASAQPIPGLTARSSRAPSPRVVAADRSFLLGIEAVPGSGTGAQSLVVLHEHRDVDFLRRVSAVGLFGTLMSSSGLAYALSMGMSSAVSGGLALQTAGAALCLAMYLRTYVARLVLDTKRARLSITGCGLFGEPMAREQNVPLALLQPGVKTSEKYIQFRVRGQPWDPFCWVWYKVPRISATKPGIAGASVWNAAAAALPITGPTPVKSADAKLAVTSLPMVGRLAKDNGASSTAVTSSSHARRAFPGAGLRCVTAARAADSAAADALVPSVPAAPMAPSLTPNRFAVAPVSPPPTVERSPLAGLRLRGGLPLNAREEQKLLDFFADPTTYAT